MSEARNKLIEITDLGNMLKSDIIIVWHNYIIGTDENVTYFKFIDYNNTDNFHFVYEKNKMKDFIKNVSMMNDIVELNNNYISTQEGDTIEVFNPNIINIFLNNFSTLNGVINNYPIDYHNENLKDDDNFNSILDRKTGEGVALYKISKKYMLSLYKNFLPAAKKDKIELYIYNITCSGKFLAKFIISKPKSIKIRVYVMYLCI